MRKNSLKVYLRHGKILLITLTLNNIDSDWKENNKHLMQYVFGQNHYVDTKELFARLELSIVTYEFMKKNKKAAKTQ